MKKGLVFNIQRYSLHDGPGIRTVVFLKGCPLRCRWCSNPESQLFLPQISYWNNKCIGDAACGVCVPVCPARAICFDAAGKAKIEREKCCNCLKCAQHCPSQAIRVEGQYSSVDEIIDIVEQDHVFYRGCEGGLTVSGGEPLAQGDFLVALLKEAKRRCIHTAIETCGMGSYEVLHEAAANMDYLLYDIKSLDADKHLQYTGHTNGMILQNIKRLSDDMPKLKKLIRTPVIPGFNNTVEELHKIQEFAAGISNAGHQLLPYHRFGEGKYKALGLPYLMGDECLDESILQQL